jgi:hypothetical protein
MNKKKFSVDLCPINHLLIGFCYQSGTLSEDTSVGIDEFSLGLGLFNINFTRYYSIA